MFGKLGLRTRIFVILFSLILITIIGGGITLWYTNQMEQLVSEIIDQHVAAFQVAEELETALVNQKGFVSYYFLDGDPDWLRQLGIYRQVFKERLKDSRSLVHSDVQKNSINKIEEAYEKYITGKDEVIGLYKSGRRDEGSRIHKEVRAFFFETLRLCRDYKELHNKLIAEALERSHKEASEFRAFAAFGVVAVFLLGVLLIFALVHYILAPVRRLAFELNGTGDAVKSQDEIKSLSMSVRGLIVDMNQTHFELAKSRENLIQAEKLAQVGRLAAGVAHSIRNPLTSVNMRLFSLARTLDLSGPQQEDFDVISEEIRHIDTIVQNFLEFSRRPKLRMQKVSPSDIVDTALQLLHHRMISYNVYVKLGRVRPLPVTQVDPDQLKEVLTNLIVNSCEAMGEGGSIVIEEEESLNDPLGRVAIIRLTDTGPGIPESIRDKVTEPFFTTKEEGTGLGLSIAVRILKEHGGRLEISSKKAEGTTVSVILPIFKEPVNE